MKTHFWESMRVAGSHRWRLARLRTTILLVVLALVCGLTPGGLQEAAGGLPGYFTDVKRVCVRTAPLRSALFRRACQRSALVRFAAVNLALSNQDQPRIP